MRLSTLNLARIRATPEGGDRRDWPMRLWPDCHRSGSQGHTDVYGRLARHFGRHLVQHAARYGNGRMHGAQAEGSPEGSGIHEVARHAA